MTSWYASSKHAWLQYENHILNALTGLYDYYAHSRYQTYLRTPATSACVLSRSRARLASAAVPWLQWKEWR